MLLLMYIHHPKKLAKSLINESGFLFFYNLPYIAIWTIVRTISHLCKTDLFGLVGKDHFAYADRQVCAS